jgi:hypothetical protein
MSKSQMNIIWNGANIYDNMAEACICFLVSNTTRRTIMRLEIASDILSFLLVVTMVFLS